MRHLALILCALAFTGCGPIGTSRAQVESGPMKYHTLVGHVPQPKDGYEVNEYRGQWNEFSHRSHRYVHVDCISTYVLKDDRVVAWTWDVSTGPSAVNGPELPSFGGL